MDTGWTAPSLSQPNSKVGPTWKMPDGAVMDAAMIDATAAAMAGAATLQALLLLSFPPIFV